MKQSNDFPKLSPEDISFNQLVAESPRLPCAGEHELYSPAQIVYMAKVALTGPDGQAIVLEEQRVRYQWLPEQVTIAKSLCRSCPIIAECLSYALSKGPDLDEIWGGTLPAERRKILKHRQQAITRQQLSSAG